MREPARAPQVLSPKGECLFSRRVLIRRRFALVCETAARIQIDEALEGKMKMARDVLFCQGGRKTIVLGLG